MMIRKKIKGTVFYGELNNKSATWGNYSGGVDCVKTKDQAYVDDVNVCIQNEEDLKVVDNIFSEFEAMSGAILSRDTKTKIMGLGKWLVTYNSQICTSRTQVEPKLLVFASNCSTWQGIIVREHQFFCEHQSFHCS